MLLEEMTEPEQTDEALLQSSDRGKASIVDLRSKDVPVPVGGERHGRETKQTNKTAQENNKGNNDKRNAKY